VVILPVFYVIPMMNVHHLLMFVKLVRDRLVNPASLFPDLPKLDVAVMLMLFLALTILNAVKIPTVKTPSSATTCVFSHIVETAL
jgi:hypothetical protein